MKKAKLLFIMVFFSSSLIQGQGVMGFRFGYNFNSFLQPMRHLQILCYQFNHAYPDAEKLTPPVLTKGPVFEWYGGDGLQFFVSWSNRHGKMSSEFTNPANGGVYVQKLKYRSNLFGFGGGGQISKKFGFGIRLDISNMKLFQKYAPKDSIKSVSWENFHSYRKGGLATGVGFYTEYYAKLTKGIALVIRPYFDWMFGLSQPAEDLDTDNYYPSTSAGLQLFISFHKKD